MWTRNPTWSVLAILIAFALATAASRSSSDSLTGRCGGPATRVHTIQGIGRSSPLLGQGIEFEEVVIEAVIVGWFPGFPRGLGGFFVQEEDADRDDDPRTSEGLFVFDTTAREPLALGTLVRVRGRVTEFFGLTELSQVSDLVVCPPRGVASPVSIELPVEDETLWERWEGMRVEFDQQLVLTGQHGSTRFGEVDLALDSRLEQATQQSEPGESALERSEWNARRRLLLDDGSDTLNPEPVPYLDRRGGGTLRLGDTLAHLEGVVDFAFGRFRIQPTEAIVFEANASRPSMPPEVAGTLRVVHWNVENHMNGDGRGGGFPTRGPHNEEELERQRAKLTETLAALDPDIATLVEIENDGSGPDSALAQLVAALNDVSAGSPYEAIHPGATRLGTHAIAVGMLYRRDTVMPVGPPAILDAQAHPDFDDIRNRPSLVQTFQAHATGESVTIVVNHFKSKGSSCDSIGDPDRGDGQGQCNATRTRAARSAVEWLANDPARDVSVPVLLTGDLNAYPREDPVRAIESAGYVDLIGRFADPAAHTFVFDGEAGRLDHMLGRADLLPFVSGAGVWSTNSDEPDVLDYHLENPPDRYVPDAFRASDHDPILVGLFPDADGDALTDPRDRCPHSVLSPTVILGECDSGVPNRLDETGCSLSDDLLAGGGFNESLVKRGRWVSEVNRRLTLQIDEGTLEPRHRAAILSCVARDG